MSKREQTQADQVLSEARARLAVAEQEERDAATELRLASAIVAVHRANLEAAEKLLTPKPRKKAGEPAASAPARKEPTADKDLKEGLCSKPVSEGGATCKLPYDNALHHDSVYKDFHKFEPPKSVARAARKSRTSSASTKASESSIANSEMAPDAIGYAVPEQSAHAGD